jgi:diphosphoinositol-polyphosphate diphosphatase
MALIQATPLGEWIFKSKSKQNSCGLKGACKGFIFALQVTELLEIWPEQVTHGRRWVSLILQLQLPFAETRFHTSSLYRSCLWNCAHIQVPVEEAYSLCRYDWMREALDRLKEQLIFESNLMPPPSPELELELELDSSSLCMVTPAVPEGTVALC